MTYLKRHYERPDLWSNIKANNILPVVTFVVGLMSTVYLFQAKIDRALDGVTDLKSIVSELRANDYHNSIDISNIKVRLGMPDDGQVKGISTPPASLKIVPKGH